MNLLSLKDLLFIFPTKGLRPSSSLPLNNELSVSQEQKVLLSTRLLLTTSNTVLFTYMNYHYV